VSPFGCLALFAAAFVGTHFLLSHPLRGPLVARMGTRRFRLVYTLVSFATFQPMLWFYRRIGDQPTRWDVPDWGWSTAAVVMWFAAILLVGSFVGNPALPGAPSADRPRGVLAITRHPMMWSFALWAIVHAALVATPKALLLDGAILVLALGGAYGQDIKKRRLLGDRWHEWIAQTAFWPFARGLAAPGLFALIGGTALFLIATWLHPMPIGPWRWLG
jgi:uncharacterized membrane protein